MRSSVDFLGCSKMAPAARPRLLTKAHGTFPYLLIYPAIYSGLCGAINLTLRRLNSTRRRTTGAAKMFGENRKPHIASGGAPAYVFVRSRRRLNLAATGPLIGYSDTWQLVINTGTTIITFLMSFSFKTPKIGTAPPFKLNWTSSSG